MRRAQMALCRDGMLPAMLSEKLRPIIEPFTSGTGKALARAHLSPNALTTIGVLAVAGCSWLIVAGERTLAGILLIPAFVIDVLDGALARASGRVSVWGGFYDSVCDRVADGILLSAIVWLGYHRGDETLMATALAALVLSQLVPYARAKAEALGVPAGSGPGERAERAVLLCAGLILHLEVWAMIALIAATAYTFVVRVLAVRRHTAVSP
jgi:CDP-diacylglycerol---glycerol-3-phosphate 3-phosphatidyltransferase